MPEEKSEIPDDIFQTACGIVMEAKSLKSVLRHKDVVNAIADALKVERETCAKIAEARKPLYGLEGSNACSEIASSILHRGALNHD